jgi:hypothetical protein
VPIIANNNNEPQSGLGRRKRGFSKELTKLWSVATNQNVKLMLS